MGSLTCRLRFFLSFFSWDHSRWLDKARMAAAFSAGLMIVACGGLSAKQQSAADEALKALRKIEAATQVGVSYQQYGQLVIDAKAQVNEATAILPEGELKKELETATDAYSDAGRVWSAAIARELFPGDEVSKYLKSKYNIEVARPISDGHEREQRSAILNVIWAIGRLHLEKASSLVKL